MDDEEIAKFQATLNSVRLNSSTALAARLAAGSLTELCLRVAVRRTVCNGFAVIRPPGHHCESETPFGFCLYSNVSVAIRAVLAEAPRTKVLVVDWPVARGSLISGCYKRIWPTPQASGAAL